MKTLKTMKIPAPKVKIKKLTIDDLDTISHPSYRLIMDIVIDHIKDHNLQDQNYRRKILTDIGLRKVLKTDADYILVDDLYGLIRSLFDAPSSV